MVCWKPSFDQVDGVEDTAHSCPHDEKFDSVLGLDGRREFIKGSMVGKGVAGQLTEAIFATVMQRLIL